MGKLKQSEVDRLIAAKKFLAGKSDGRGLTITVSKTGLVAWTLRYRFDGRMREMTLTNHKNLKEARKLALAPLALLGQGKDPLAERRPLKLLAPAAEPGQVTFQDIAAEYERVAGPDLADITLEHARQYLKREIYPAIGSLEADAITAAQIKELIKAV